MRALVESALPACHAASLPQSRLNHLEQIEATILSNRAIAKIHGEFLKDRAPTDVITFPYGEILIGAGIVSKNAERFGHTATEEAALCVIHGLLHLAGWRDQTAQEAKVMAEKQEQIFKTARRMVCSRTHESD
jgi:probable rRNA maturation factor